MAVKKWEDLEKDCLWARSHYYMTFLVCKSWYRASLDPSCWKIINFQEFVRQLPLVDEYLKSIINRSQGNATTVMLPTTCSDEVLRYLADECPALKALYLPSIDVGADIGREAASAIVTFLPNIKYLHIRNGRIDRKNLEIIMQGCKELVHLDVRGSLIFM
ncbi:putative f-box/lrr-repeat protein 19, partial [Quercus suber]